MNEYSVLMSVYEREKPEYLDVALNSLWAQTISTDDVVLICDGPLNDELDRVIAEHQKAHEALHVCRLKENGGLGAALAYGVPLCRHEFILRMDSDDISAPERAERQVEALSSGLDLISSDVDLFETDPSSPFAKRVVPKGQKQIIRFSKKRSPFNHPSVAFRKQSVLEAGNYQPLLYKEDYFLWVRMLHNGARADNSPEVMTHMRENSGTLTRRSSKKAYVAQMNLLKYMRDIRYINAFEYMNCRFLYWIQSVLPLWATKLSYSIFLRRRTKG